MRIFIISDLHFNDNVVMNEFDRPFSSVDGMNDFLIEMWNSTVSETDLVILVGDVLDAPEDESHEQVRSRIQYRFEQLNGDIVLVPGNHDEIGPPTGATFKVERKPEFEFDEFEFYCQHRPPSSRREQWVIHGHEHTNNNDEYPFINPTRRTVNVSAELLHYIPLQIESLVELIRTEERYSYCPFSSLNG